MAIFWDEPTDEEVNGKVRIRNCAILENGYMVDSGLLDKSKKQEQSKSRRMAPIIEKGTKWACAKSILQTNP